MKSNIRIWKHQPHTTPHAGNRFAKMQKTNRGLRLRRLQRLNQIVLAELDKELNNRIHSPQEIVLRKAS